MKDEDGNMMFAPEITTITRQIAHVGFPSLNLPKDSDKLSSNMQSGIIPTWVDVVRFHKWVGVEYLAQCLGFKNVLSEW